MFKMWESQHIRSTTVFILTHFSILNNNLNGISLLISHGRYRAQISVYDNSEQAVFVLLGDAGFELTGKHAAELVSSYFEVSFITRNS